MKNHNSLFVTGCFRSGTSLLYACLNQHPDIALMYETGLFSIPLPPKLTYHRRWLENANAWGKFLSRHQLPAQPSDAAADFHDITEIYRAYAAKKGARYFGEKCPSLMTDFNQLVVKYPHTKIITIYRHPRAIHHSVLQAALNDHFFADPQTLNRQLYAQEKMYQEALKLKKQGYDILHITYDELCDETESTCRKICAYLDLPYTDRMLNLTGADMSAVFLAKHHIKLREGVIEKTPRSLEEISPELRQSFEVLSFRWERMRNFLIDQGDESVFSEPLDSLSEVLIHQGVKSCRSLRFKRRVYHLAPAEIIRIFRAFKIMLNELKELREEHISPEQRRANYIYSCLITLFLIFLGSSVYIMSKAVFSPLLVFMLVPITSAWLVGESLALMATLLAVLAYCLCENYVPPPDTFLSFLWNYITRFSAFSILIFFTLHLKVTFLKFQKNLPRD